MASDQQVVLITRGAAGIGRVIAQRFLDRGDAVHVCDVSAQSIERFLEANPAATASVADVGQPEQVQQVFQDIQRHYAALDVLVNNAGIAGPTAPLDEVRVEDWDKTVAVDLSGAFYCARLAAPLLMRRGGGSIINVSSNAAFFGFPLRSPYTAAKWALIGLTKTWAMELGPHGIRVNAVCPGSVDGARIDGVIERDAAQRGVAADEIRELYMRQSSLGRFVSPEEVAAMIIFLCSPSGSAISGQALAVDGHTESLSPNTL